MSRKSIVSVAVITPLVLSVMCVSPANAATNTDPATNSFGQCLTTPTSDKTVNHAEQAHVDKTVVPGVGQVSHLERRWNRQIPAVEAVSHSESPFQRTITGSAEVSHEQWLYQQFIAGNKEQSHQEHQFSRENPGQAKVSHLLYQFSRENPGQQTVSHQEFQFTRTVPGQVEQSHQEYKYQQVTKNSHTENRYKKSIKLYTVEHKKVQIPYQGKDHDKLVTWLNKIGATNLGGNWWQLPDAVVAAAGVNPFNVAQSGSVNMNAYGGPSVTVSYQITGIETYDQPPAGSFVSLGNQTVYYTGGTSFSLNASDAIWVNGSLAGWNSFDARSVNDADTVTPYNNGNWTTDVNPAGFTKVDQRTVIDQPKTDERTEYRMVDGSPTTDLAQAAWFKESSFGGWSQFGTAKVVEDQQYVAPFTQYRTADGSVRPMWQKLRSSPNRHLKVGLCSAHPKRSLTKRTRLRLRSTAA